MNISKSKKAVIILGIFIVAALSMFQSLYLPAIADLYGAYGNQIPALNYFISGSGICNLITMFLCPFIEKKTGAKPLFLIGVAFLAISGIIGLFSANNLTILCIAQSINLCGYGITGTMALSVLMQLLSTEKQRGFFNGIYQVVIAASASLFAIVGGIWASQSWQKALNGTWWVVAVLGIIAVLILVFTLPKDIGSTSDGESSGSKDAPWGKILLLFFAFLIIGTVYQYINLMMSVYVEENSLGTAVFTGHMQSLGTIGSAVMCFCFGFVYPKLKKKIILVPLAVFTVFVFLLHFIPSPALTTVAALLMGAAFGCSVTFFYTICPEIAPNHLTLAVAWIGLGLNIPYMIYSYMYTFLASVFGTMTASLLPFGFLILAELIVAAVIVCRKR